MAVARVKKIELYVHRTAVEEVLSVLQERGITEISAAARSSAEEPSAHPARSGRDYAPALNDVNYLTRYLAPYYKDPVGTLGRMLGERDDVSVEKLAALADKVDAGNLAAEARKRERRLTELRSDMQQIKSLQQTLSGLGNFEPPLSMITEGSQMVAGFLGTGRAEDLQEWKNAVEETLGADAL